MSNYGGSVSSPVKDNVHLSSAMMRHKKNYRVQQGSVSYQSSGIGLPYNQGLATTQIIPGTAESINIGTPGSIQNHVSTPIQGNEYTLTNRSSFKKNGSMLPAVTFQRNAGMSRGYSRGDQSLYMSNFSKNGSGSVGGMIFDHV